MADKLLLHICCAPCSIYTWHYFQHKGFKIQGLFFNPNIQPYRELARRKKALYSLAASEKKEIIYYDDYPLEEFLSMAMESNTDRCAICYQWRLKKTAAYALENGIPYFSTSLLLSPYQKHELLKETGEKISEEFGVNFVYSDLREGFQESMEKAKKAEIYRQGYCGCIFSEKERYYLSRNGRS